MYVVLTSSMKSIEWAEDQIIYRYGGYDVRKSTAHLNEQALLAGLANQVLDAIVEALHPTDISHRRENRCGGRPRFVCVLSSKRHGER